MKFTLTKIKIGRYAGQWRYGIVAANGEKIDPRQIYNDKRDALNAIHLIRQMAEAPIEVSE